MADSITTTESFVRKAVLFEGALGAAAIVFGSGMTLPPLRQIRGDGLAAGWGLVAAIPLLLLMFALRRLNVGPFGRLNRAVDGLLVPLFSGCTLADFALISLVGGLGEELLFRGLIQSALCNWLGLAAGLVLASLIFGLVHLITPTYAVVATVVGAYFGWLAIAFDNLLPAIVAHAVYDFVALAYLTHRKTVDPEKSTIDNRNPT